MIRDYLRRCCTCSHCRRVAVARAVLLPICCHILGSTGPQCALDRLPRLLYFTTRAGECWSWVEWLSSGTWKTTRRGNYWHICVEGHGVTREEVEEVLAGSYETAT